MQKHHTAYSRRRALLTAAVVLLAAVGLSTSTGATASKRSIITISHTMALPGATLPPGTYEFEVVNPGSTAEVVAVTGKAGPARVRFLGLTRRVDRPRTLSGNQSLVFGEAAPGEPIPITAWYPIGYSSGHQFIY